MFITKKSDLFVFIKMSTIEQLLEVLEEIAKIIQKTQINLKKCPKQRLTRGYIRNKIKMFRRILEQIYFHPPRINKKYNTRKIEMQSAIL